MRIFIAGGSGVLGVRLIPLLIGVGHEVAAMTRTADKGPALHRLGAIPVVCDVFDVDMLHEEMKRFAPDSIFHSLTNLPDRQEDMPSVGETHLRILTEGTDNLLAAAQACGVTRLFAQSIAWKAPGRGAAAYEHLERSVLATDGTVLRYGRWYGRGTWHEIDEPAVPRIHIDAAAKRTVEGLDSPPGVHTLIED